MHSSSSITPREEPGRERHQHARVGLAVVDADASERNGDRGVERKAVEIDAGSAADRVQMLGTLLDRQPIEIVDPRVIPEGVAFDSGLAPARRKAAAETDLGLRAVPTVAEQSARVVAAADGVIA